MIRLLANWLLSAVALLVVSRVVSGFQVDTLGTALIAAVVFGLLNATVGLLLKLVTLPLTIITFGIFLLVVNAVVLKLASGFVPGFHPQFWRGLLGRCRTGDRADAVPLSPRRRGRGIGGISTGCSKARQESREQAWRLA